jgi:hypothetical protein
MEQPSLSREVWGPRFWRVLHILAECSGSQPGLILQNDEADAWSILFKAQRFVMPCQLCREHYSSWIISHKLIDLRLLVGEERRAWIRSWLWGCHTNVNTTNGKGSPDLDDLRYLYPKQSVEKEVQSLYSMFQFALEKRKLKAEDIARWKLIIGRLRVMYGI